jgi:hypothetical protein
MPDITRSHTRRQSFPVDDIEVQDIEVELVEADPIDAIEPQSAEPQSAEPEVLSPQRLPVKLVAARRDRVIDVDAGDGRGRRRRGWRAAGRFAATLGIGVAMLLAWPIADAARMMIADAAPQLWLARSPGPGDAAMPTPARRSDAAVSGLAAVRGRIAEIAASTEAMTRAVAQLAAGQARLADDIAKAREEAEQRLVPAAPRSPSPAAARGEPRSAHPGMARPVPAPAPRPASSAPGRHLALNGPAGARMPSRAVTAPGP